MKLVITTILLMFSTSAYAQDFDLVITKGRVIDPETNLDAMRNVGISNGSIQVVTNADVSGTETIDASGHVVAPGFIDFHWHGQDPFGIKLALRGGVTSPLELEVGAYGGHAVQTTNFYSPPPPKTSANWLKSFLHRSKHKKPDKKGARVKFRDLLSAPATCRFSTDRLTEVVRCAGNELEICGLFCLSLMQRYLPLTGHQVAEKIAALQHGFPKAELQLFHPALVAL